MFIPTGMIIRKKLIFLGSFQTHSFNWTDSSLHRSSISSQAYMLIQNRQVCFIALPFAVTIVNTLLQLLAESSFLFCCTLEPQFNESPYNQVLGIMNDILQSGLLKCIEKNLDTTHPRYNEPMSLVPSHFIASRFHCKRV